MEIRLARSLAESNYLSEDMLFTLWRSGDTQVQKTLAKRGYLPFAIESELVLKDELIPYWCSRERGGVLLKTAIKNSVLSKAVGCLVEQRSLDEDDFKILVGKVDKNSVFNLLKREDLNRETRDLALKVFTASASYKSGSFGEALTGVVGQSIEDWLTIIESSTWDNSGLIAQAAYYLNRDEVFMQAYIDKFESLDQYVTTKINQIGFLEREVDRDITRTWKIFLTCYSLDNNYLSEAFQHSLFLKINSERETLLNERLKFNFKEAIAKLSCSELDGQYLKVNNEHAEIIEYLTLHGDRGGLPVELIAKEALIHREILQEGIVNNALSNLLGSGSRSLAVELLDIFPTDLGREYFKLKGVNLLGEHKNRVSVLKYLASIGHSDIRSSSISFKEKAMVFDYIKPLNNFVGESEYTSILLKKIEILPKKQQEFVYTLLPDWEGTFADLVRASYSI